MADQSIGIMNEAFFVSKSEILNWANNLLKTNLTKIEQFGTGAAYCQIIDSMHKGKVKMSKVNWKARNEWEFLIERLAKAKYQDNLEFVQWMKRYYDLNGGCQEDYDPIKRRSGEENQDKEIDFSFVELRDNGARKIRERNDSTSADRFNKKLYSRSKSPLIKGLEKNPPLLQQKSKDIRNNSDQLGTLIQKFREIEKMLGQVHLNEKEKINGIQEIVNLANKLPCMQQQQKGNQRVSMHQQQQQQQQKENVIIEENESPKMKSYQKRNSQQISVNNNIKKSGSEKMNQSEQNSNKNIDSSNNSRTPKFAQNKNVSIDKGNPQSAKITKKK